MKYFATLFIAAMTALPGLSYTEDLSPQKADVLLVIRFHATDEGHPELVRLLQAVPEAMENEPGFKRAWAYQDVDQPGEFVLMEVWETKTSHMAHFRRINESGDWSRIRNLLVANPEMRYHNLLPQPDEVTE